MSNRAVRRQRLKEPKERPGGRPLPRPTRTGPREPAPARRRGPAGLVPRFFLDIWSELKKVVWPTRDDVVYLTVVVVIVTIILGAILGAIDIGFGWFIEKTLLS
jgi:preprotein translocase subunit SecE